MSRPGELNGPPSMSADGRHVTWLSSGDSAPRITLFDVPRRATSRVDVKGVGRARAFTWSHLPGVGLLVTDADGTERWALSCVHVDTGVTRPLSRGPGAQTRIAALSPRRPGQVVLATNERDPARHDYDTISLRTGRRARLLTNQGYSAVYVDQDLHPRLVETVARDGARELWHGDPARRRLFLRLSHEEAPCFRFVRFSEDGDVAYAVRPDGAAGVRLVGLRCVADRPAEEVETLLALRRADVHRVLPAHATGRPELVEIDRFRPRTVALDPALAPVLRRLRDRLEGEPAVLQRSAGGRHWLLAEHRCDTDVRYHLYEPADDALLPVSRARPGHAPLPVDCRPVDVPLRDGQRAVTYLTRPRCTRAAASPPGGAPPTILLVHGGPWRRSRWNFEERRASLAALGYTIVEPNFRGSTGFGAAWVNAGDRQWGGRLQEDLEDALDWACGRGHADPERIALYGGSYGGYAALQLAATTGRLFACVVARAPVTDLVAFTEAVPPFWQTAAAWVHRRVGDPGVPGQRRMLARRSPLWHAAAMRCPVLLIHGMNDARVPVRMSTDMFMALARHDREATLALFLDEGHEIVGTDNRRACQALIAGFLGRHLRRAGEQPAPPPPAGLKLLRTPRAARAAGHAGEAD